jgi:lysophospholipase L1-like esterase
MYSRRSVMLWRFCFVVFVGALFVFAIAAKEDNANRFEGEIEKFENADRDNPPPEGGIVFVGSSSIRLWDLKKYFPDLPAINRGFGGSEAADALRYVERIVIKYKPRLIVYYEGDNDLKNKKTPEQILKEFEAFVNQVHDGLPETKILFLSVKPSPARWELYAQQHKTNELVKEFAAKDPLVEYVDVGSVLMSKDGKPDAAFFGSDGLHLNADGYQVWTEALKPKLQ